MYSNNLVLRPARTRTRTRRHCRGVANVLTMAFVAASLGSVQFARAQNLTDVQIGIVVNNLAVGATHSWELGTRAQTLIELDTPSFSVLNTSAPLPPSQNAPSSLQTVLNLAAAVLTNRTKAANGRTGPQPLVAGDGSAADPASNGVAMLIANWTGQGNSSLNFGQAATDQIDFLFSSSVPKTADGAISHRTDQLQLWSDFMYMVPPFLAYYGTTTSNRSMVEEAYTQCKLYRSYLRDSVAPSGSKNNVTLWKHVLLGASGNDEGHWSTGNGWAAMGMLRVLGTIKNSQYANSMKNEQNDLTSWIGEIQDGMFAFIPSTNIFTNYADDSSSFVDAASTALMAATVYRNALLTNTHKHLPAAEASRKALSATSSGGTSSFAFNATSLAGAAHFTADGWLTPVVNPNQFGIEGSHSPEGQAFVIMMQSAWRDWVQAGAPGANGGSKGNGAAPSSLAVGLVTTLVSFFTSGWGSSEGDE